MLFFGVSARPTGKKDIPEHRARNVGGRASSTEKVRERPGKRSSTGPERPRPAFGSHLEWILLGLILIFIVVVRARLLSFPLERDEGEYAYLGQLIQQGFPPYGLAYNMKLPGTYYMYALVMSFFGQNVTGIHLGLMVMNCATILLVYKIGAKTVNSSAGVIAACTYAFLSLSSSVLGFAGHATHFVVFWAVAGILALLYAQEKEKWHLYFAAGVLLGLAFIMKQPAIFFPFFGVAAIVAHLARNNTLTLKRTTRSLIPFLGGVLLPLLIMIVYLYRTGVFDKFWFFTFVYSFKYGSQVPVSMAPDIFMANFPGVVGSFFLVWLFGALGLVCLFLHPRLKDKRLTLSLFAVCSFLTVCPGFYFRQHYFVTFLPAVSLLTGVFIDYVYVRSLRVVGGRLPASGRLFAGCIAAAVFAAALTVGFVQQSDYMFTKDPRSLCREFYGANPFPESIEVARFIKDHTAASDKIAVIGSEPQIYFYSDRHSATGYIYTYSLMEIHEYSLDMQKEMASEIERANPAFLVFVNVATSWLARPESERFIFRWSEAYLRAHYNLVGIADIIGPNRTDYKWYNDARGYVPVSPSNLLVFQRR